MLVRMEEFLRSSLLHLAARFEAETGISPATASKRALNDNTFFARIESGAGFSVRTADRVLQWFADNWPEGVQWPKGLERPARSESRPPFREGGGQTEQADAAA